MSDPVIAAAGARMVRSWRLRIWLVIATGLGVGLTRLPLFGVLGYEHALAVAVFASLAGLDLGATLGRRVVGVTVPGLARAIAPWRLIGSLTARAVGLALAVTIVPGAIAAIHGLWAPTCDWEFGLRAYALLPLASASLAASAGVVTALVCGPRGAMAAIAPWLVLLALVIAGVWRFYSAPPVFVYSPIIGYFPGNLYDENVSLGAALWAARAEQLAVVVAALAACAALADAPTLRLRLRGRRPRGWRGVEVAAFVIAAGGAAALRGHAGALGYAVDASDIEAFLDGTRRTPHFVIHYAHRPGIDADIDLIAADHEFRLAQVERALGVRVTAPIDSYYFPDADTKARWMGARGVEMAKPWRHDIYLNHDGFPHGALRHEIAHVVAGEFGDPWFSVSAARLFGMPLMINPGLIEGLAVAAEWPGNASTGLTPHEQVRAMEVMGLAPSVDDLLSLGFLSVSPARGYTTGGSFLRFLLERDGAGPMQALYHSGGDFAGAYGKPQAALVAEWRAMIASIALAPSTIEQVRERFRHPGVFARPCPHAIAARNAAAAEALAADDPARAIVLMRIVCDEEPDEPRHQLDLATALDAGGPAEQAEARAIWSALAKDGDRVTSSLRAQALEQLGRRAAAAGEWGAARALFLAGTALPVEDGRHRMLDGMVRAIDHLGPAAGALHGYFFTDGDRLAWATLITVTEPSLAFGWYLHGLQSNERGDHASATRDLRRALDLGLPGRRFVREAIRRLLISAWRAGDLAAVARAADVLAGDGATAMDTLVADDWRARLAWITTGALP